MLHLWKHSCGDGHPFGKLRARSRSSGRAKVDSQGWPILARFLRKGGKRCSIHKGMSLAMALTLAMAGSGCRIDMHVQPRVNPLARSDFFTDQRSARPPVEGTVARGQLRDDTYFYTGKIGSSPGD